jgi:hypothetical protein
MAGGNNLRKYVQNTLPGIVRGMVAKGGVSSYNTDKGNGIWMRGGKLGADSWHMGQIGKAISSGALSTRGISNASDFKMPGMTKRKTAKGKYNESKRALSKARKANRR